MRRYSGVPLIVAVALAGCAGVPRGPDYARVPLGSELQLADGLRASDNGFVYFQDGGVVAVPNRMRAPWCRLRGAPGAVPRTWTVTGFDVREWETGISLPGAGIGMGHEREVPLTDFRSLIDLQTAGGRSGQLRCAARERAWIPGGWLSLEEINAVLGAAGSLGPPPPGEL